ncbi:MAG: hypothetical protein ACLPV4_10765, partial [Solirubrobacteraceae bacterium]
LFDRMPYRRRIELDSQLAALASRQYGIVTREQLFTLGFRRDAITYRRSHKQLFPVHLGVYAVGRPPNTPLERASAAVLACGPGAALSHSSALTLWGLDRVWRLPLHVTCPDQRRRPPIVTHKSPGLTRADIRVQLGIRVTSTARTFLDCTPELADKRLARLAADARRSGHLHLDQLLDALARFPYHPGCQRLQRILDGLGSPTRSEFERGFIQFCAYFGLPIPLINVRFAGHEVDAFFPAERLIVELDGWDYHRDRHSFESDRDRDADTLAAGAATIRITWERMTHAPRREADRLQAILEQRRPVPLLG